MLFVKNYWSVFVQSYMKHLLILIYTLWSVNCTISSVNFKHSFVILYLHLLILLKSVKFTHQTINSYFLYKNVNFTEKCQSLEAIIGHQYLSDTLGLYMYVLVRA